MTVCSCSGIDAAPLFSGRDSGLRTSVDSASTGSASEVALVFIFPRGTGRGGILDPDEVVVEPMRKAWRIFGKRGHDSALYENLWGEKEYFGDLKGQWQDLCRSSEKDTGKLVDAFSRLLKPPVTQQVFQQVVRETILDILDINGIVCSRFESIDCDEVPPRACVSISFFVASGLFMSKPGVVGASAEKGRA